jgi:hypothetical protein
MPGTVKLIAATWLLATLFDVFTIGRYAPARSTFARLVIELTILLLLCFGSDRIRVALRIIGVVGMIAGGVLIREGATIGIEHEAGLVGVGYGVLLVIVNGYTVWALGSADVRAWFRRARELGQDEE